MASSYKKVITLGLDYSDFQGGVSACNTEMKKLDSEFALAREQMGGVAKESEKLQLQNDYLSNKMALQSQKVEELKKKYEAYKEELGEGSKKTENANLALKKAQTELQKTKNEYDKLTIAQSNLKESLTLLVGVLGGIAAAFLDSAKAAAEYADQMLTLSDQTSIGVETLQKWEYASDFVDVSLDTMTGSLKKLESNMASASSGSGSAADAFKKLGLSVTDANGEMKSAEQMFYETIDALGKIKNSTEQDQVAMQVFGKSAFELAGVINAGSKGLKAYGQEAEELGRIMSEADAEKAAQLQDAMDALDSAFNSLRLSLASDIIPMLTKFIDAIASVPTPVLKTIVVIASVVATIIALSNAINSVTKAGGAIKSVLGGMSFQFDSVYVKVMLAVVALTALAAIIAVIIGKGKELNSTLQSVGDMSSGMTGGGRYPTGHNAKGTQNWRGGPTWVGENGPEIVDVPKGSRIYNNDESQSIANNNTYNITMNCDLSKMKSVNDVVEAVQGLSNSRRAYA